MAHKRLALIPAKDSGLRVEVFQSTCAYEVLIHTDGRREPEVDHIFKAGKGMQARVLRYAKTLAENL